MLLRKSLKNMRNRITLAILISIFYCSTIQAQTKHQKDSTAKQIQHVMDSLHDYCYVCTNHEHLIIKPPYTKRFVKELPFLITSGLTFAGGFLAAAVNKTEPYTREQLLNNTPDINSINRFDRSSALNWSPSIARTSDYILFSISVLPALFLSENHTSRDITTLLIMYAEVFTLNYGLTNIAKFTANRPRPYVYNPDTTKVSMGTRSGGGSRQSFFSGHTSQTAAATFFFAKAISDYHPTLKPGVKLGLWIFAASVPAANGYFRVKAGKHFPTDVITGYIAGAATGFLIPELHRTKKSKEQKNNLNMGILPTENGGMQMQFMYRF